jgi:adenosylcobyric acid synthase
MTPWLAAARKLPAEDAVLLEPRGAAGGAGRTRIVAPLPRGLSNFDDFDPLANEPDVDFAFIPPGQPLPGNADLIILPGSKTTLSDLAMFRAEGWDIDLKGHVRRGGRVLGICGGYQMLGMRVSDPGGVEGPPAAAEGLGLLDVETVLTQTKTLRPVSGRLTGSQAAFTGYEMHLGVTTGAGLGRPFLVHDDGRPDGAVSADGRIAGAYCHGLFARGEARAAILAELGAASIAGDHGERVEGLLDDIAQSLAESLDIAAISRIAGL